MRQWIEKIAIRYLEKRGFLVLPTNFSGAVVGFGELWQISEDAFAIHLRSPKKQLIAMNHSSLNLSKGEDNAVS